MVKLTWNNPCVPLLYIIIPLSHYNGAKQHITSPLFLHSHIFVTGKAAWVPGGQTTKPCLAWHCGRWAHVYI